MKNEILKLREEGKSYKQIRKILGCSLGTIAYHCGEGQKEKYLARQRKFRRNNVVAKKVSTFKHPSAYKRNRPKEEIKSNKRKCLQSKADDFQRARENGKIGKHLGKTFTYKDVLTEYGEQTNCYLSGRPISLLEPRTYQFDHKIPASKGGDCSFENLGIACREANVAKGNMTPEELLELCKDILEYNGYKVKKKG